MKTIEELATIGAAAALPLCQPKGSWTMSVHSSASFWSEDQPARESFAAAIRDAVLADQPSAVVPTWRPIAELPADDGMYVYWDGVMAWSGTLRHKVDATHYIALPPNPDLFEVWWASHKTYINSKETARHAWDAAREAKA